MGNSDHCEPKPEAPGESRGCCPLSPVSPLSRHQMGNKPSTGDLSLNPGDDMDACKCIVPSRHGGTINSRRSASPLVRLVEGEMRCETPDHLQGVLPQNWGGNEPNRAIT
ncbi:uncharacterized protein TNCV_285301 [Trichonephila clavipes]|nr:uncharacterized protein TNCV_285301 [Trichonephila clavipes]